MIYVDGNGCPLLNTQSDDSNIDERYRHRYDIKKYKYKCYNLSFENGHYGIIPIVKASLGLTPLQDVFLFNLINEILVDSVIYEKILLYGYSLGGLIVNRVAEIFIKLYKELDLTTHDDKENIKACLKALFNKLHIKSIFNTTLSYFFSSFD